MCGNPENRQVPTSRPQIVNALSAYNVVDIAVGGEHTLALTSTHHVFSWGCNTDGQVSCEFLTIFIHRLYVCVRAKTMRTNLNWPQ